MKQNIEIKATLGVKGRYKFIRRKAKDESIVEETPWCNNLMTLYFFNQALGQANGTLQPQACVVGTGNATPAESNTTLQSYLANTTTKQGGSVWTKNWTVSPRTVKFSQTFRFGEGVAAGNVAEAGICITSSGVNAATPVISRCLVVDGGGTPTIITVLSDEFLDVIWELTYFIPEDVAGSFNQTIDGVVTAFNYTVRGIDLNSARWGTSGGGRDYLGHAPSYSPTSGSYNTQAHSAASTSSVPTDYDASMPSVSATTRVINATAAPYVADSKQRSWTLYWGLNEANIAIRSIYITCGGSTSTGSGIGCFKITFDIPVNKISTKLYNFTYVVSMANVP